jgi:outer membrane protein assembly factor BamB
LSGDLTEILCPPCYTAISYKTRKKGRGERDLTFTNNPRHQMKNNWISPYTPLWAIGGVLALFLASCQPLVTAPQKSPPPQTAPSAASDDWPTYMRSIERSGFNAAETSISAATISHLKLRWIDQGTSRVFSQPIVAHNLIFWGSGDGYEHATDLGGHRVWAANLGWSSSVCPGNGDDKNGVLNTPTVASVLIHGKQTEVLFVGGGNARFYALDALTGAILWSTVLGTPPATFLWSSPAFYQGRIYEGVASLSGCPQVQGGIVEMDAGTGKVLHAFDTVPDGCLGGSVWGSPTLDVAGNALYVGTGNQAQCASPEPYAVALVKLRLSDLALLDVWQIPHSQQIPDSDFGATPTLFEATKGGVRHQLIGLANKNGVYYAFDRRAIGHGPVWKVALGGIYSIASSAWDGIHLYMGGRDTTYQGRSCEGTVSALDPAHGAFVWRHCLGDGPVLGAITEIPGVVIVAEASYFLAIATADGRTLFRYTDRQASFVGPASVSHGALYIGSYSGGLYAFGL